MVFYVFKCKSKCKSNSTAIVVICIKISLHTRFLDYYSLLDVLLYYKINMDSSRQDNIDIEYGKMNEEYIKIINDYEKCKQELYNTSRSYTVLKGVYSDLESENESLNKENTLLKQKLNNFDNENQNLKHMFKEQMQNSDSILKEKDEQMNKLKNTILELNNVPTDTTSNFQDDIDKLNSENLQLNNENKLLQNQLLRLEEEQAEKIIATEQSIEHLRKQISELCDNLNQKKEQVTVAEGQRESMKEEMMLLRIEIETLKNTQHTQSSKGNSLFAEVNDRRLEIQNEMKSLKHELSCMKQNLSLKNSQIRKIQLENECLINQIIEKSKEECIEKKSEKEAYLTKIKDLTETNILLRDELNRSKIEIKIPNDKIPDNIVEYLHSAACRSRKEFMNLESRIVSEYTDKFFVKESLIDAKRYIQQWKTEALQYKTEVSSLQLKLDELRLKMNEHSNVDEVFKSESSNYVDGSVNSNILQDIRNQKLELNQYSEASQKQSDFIKAEINSERKIINSLIEHNAPGDTKENVYDGSETTECKAKQVYFSSDTVEPAETDHTKRQSKGSKFLKFKKVYT